MAFNISQIMSSGDIDDSLTEAAASVIATTVLPQLDPTNPQGSAFPFQFAGINVRNNTPVVVSFAILPSNEEQGGPAAPIAIIPPFPQGWWTIQPNQELYVYECYTRVFYWYAQSQHLKWSGQYERLLQGGGKIFMRREDMGASYRAYHPPGGYTLPLQE